MNFKFADDFKFDQYFLKPEQNLERSQFTFSFPRQKDQSLDFAYSVWVNKATNQLYNGYLTLKQNIRHNVCFQSLTERLVSANYYLMERKL